MNIEGIELTPTMMMLIPAVALILQKLKELPYYAYIKGFGGVLSLVIGIVLAYATSTPDPILNGIVIGVAATGGYEVLKKPKTTLIENIKNGNGTKTP
jgi:hypothetical protein